MPTSPPGALLASPPRHLTHPGYVDSAGPEAVALAASGGLHLDPWQAETLEVGLGERADGRWAARSVGLVVPRQNGKGSILEALILACLLLFREKLILYSAHEFKTAHETFIRIKELIERNADLASRVAKIHEAHGAEGIELTTGHRLRFVARSKGSGRGFSPQRIILDEALNLTARAVRALLYSMSAQDNPQLWYVSSAPDDSPEAAVLRSVMRRGRAGDDNLAYLEWSADPALVHRLPDGTWVGLDDRTAWAQANPGYPHRITDETITGERSETGEDPAGFAQERLGVVDLDDANVARWLTVTEHDWLACERPEHKPSGRLRYALDVDENGKGQQWAAVGVSDGTHVEIVTPPEVGPGTAWLLDPDHPKSLIAKRQVIGELLVAADGPAAALIEPLRKAGIRVRAVQPTEFAQASMQLLDAVIAHALRHIDQPVLNAAVAGAVTRDVADGQRRFSRSRSPVDIGPLNAVLLARWAALCEPAYDGPLVAVT